jgi:uncharacterized glyoxalase superfamily metalloenzyme YdcJ
MNTDLTTNELNTVYDVSQNQQTMIESRQKAYDTIMNAQKKELVQVIMRQTEYTELEAETKLVESDYKVIKVLNDYHGIIQKEKGSPTTTNQQIYGEIRNLMDTGAKNFRVEQEKAELYKKYQEANENQKKLADTNKTTK